MTMNDKSDNNLCWIGNKFIELSEIIIPVEECVAFRKSKDEFGAFSNMNSSYHLTLCGFKIPSSENLYQACRYPDYKELQYSIIQRKNPYESKLYAHHYLDYTRKDWKDVNVLIMHWCLQIKLYFYYKYFKELFKSTNGAYIVEHSNRDTFWGAMLKDGFYCKGVNALGKLIMLLKDELLTYISTDPKNIITIYPPDIPNFMFLGKEVKEVVIPL